MEVETNTYGDVTVIALRGTLDHSTAPKTQQLIEEFMPHSGAALLDLNGVSYMASAGLRILLLLYRQAERDGVRLSLVGVPPEVRDVMAATGFLDLFTIADTVEAGVDALSR